MKLTQGFFLTQKGQVLLVGYTSPTPINLSRQVINKPKKKDSIGPKDLISFPWSRRADVLSARFTHELEIQKRKNPKQKPSLSLAILKTVKWPIIALIIVQTAFVFVRIFSAWIVRKLIDCYTDPTTPRGEPYKWAGIMSACLVVGFHLEHHFNHLATYFPNHVQSALINLIYGKMTRISTDALTKISIGRIINLCTNGVNLFEQLGLFTVSIIVGPLGLIAGGALLWQYFGPYCLVALGYIVFWWPWQELAIIVSLKNKEATNRATATRIKMTNEAIEAIRLLKMYTWEMKFKEKIDSLRKVEINMLQGASYVSSIIRGLSFSTQVITTFLMFIAYALSGHDLTAGTVFSAYFVVAYLRLYSSYFFGLSMNFLTDTRLLLKNIENVLEAPEIGDVVFESPRDIKNAAEFDNYTAYWNTDAPLHQQGRKDKPTTQLTDKNRPTLVDINLNIKRGSLNALVGSVGSGKTSFLMTFTGEMPKTVGSLRYQGTIAYVEQEPTIFGSTFRENVLFGRPYEPEFYQTVVKACNLENDLKLFPKGDMSLIAEKGNNLSGGQKARLALARAVYSKADIYLLDDPLSAVDPKVARSIYNNAIEGVLKKERLCC